MTVDRNDKRFFDFMCSCGEGEKECERVYEEVKQQFRDEEEKWVRPKESNDKNFVNKVVYGLQNMKHGEAFITGIPSDMWSAVDVEYTKFLGECEHWKDTCQYLPDDDERCNLPDCEEKVTHFSVECDEIHHGLARVYQLVSNFDQGINQE